MEQHLGKNIINPAQREAYLKDNCDSVEEIGYMKPYTAEEIQSHKENLANLSIQIQEIQNEKAVAMALFKGRIKPLLEQRGTIVGNLKAKAKYVTEVCYKFTDQYACETGFYNAEGDLVECRPATVDELNTTIFAALREQTEQAAATPKEDKALS